MSGAQKPPPDPSTQALLLAAGSGSRFGGRKLLARWEDGTVLTASLAAAMAAPAAGVAVVTGSDAGDIEDACRAFARSIDAEDRLALVHAGNYRDGLSASLKAGIAALPTATRSVFIFLGDMPAVPHTVAGLLARALESSAVAALPVFEGRPGHPALIRHELFPEIMELSGDLGAKPVLARYLDRTAFVPVDDAGVLLDVDVPADLVRQHS